MKKTKTRNAINDNMFKQLTHGALCLSNGTKSIREMFVLSVMLLCTIIIDARIVIICFLSASTLLFIYYLIKYISILKWFQKQKD